MWPDLDLSFSCWQIVKDENAEPEVGGGGERAASNDSGAQLRTWDDTCLIATFRLTSIRWYSGDRNATWI
jgi:hypothetical protein